MRRSATRRRMWRIWTPRRRATASMSQRELRALGDAVMDIPPLSPTADRWAAEPKRDIGFSPRPRFDTAAATWGTEASRPEPSFLDTAIAKPRTRHLPDDEFALAPLGASSNRRVPSPIYVHRRGVNVNGF